MLYFVSLSLTSPTTLQPTQYNPQLSFIRTDSNRTEAGQRRCRIFLVGDEACRLLEQGWEKEPRVVCLSGQLGIRDTLALAQQVEVVIGCETGVLNAVAFVVPWTLGQRTLERYEQ